MSGGLDREGVCQLLRECVKSLEQWHGLHDCPNCDEGSSDACDMDLIGRILDVLAEADRGGTEMSDWIGWEALEAESLAKLESLQDADYKIEEDGSVIFELRKQLRGDTNG